MRYRLAATILILPLASAATEAPGTAPSVAEADDLDLFADALPPRQQSIEVAMGGCTTGYRTKLATNKDDIAVEKAIPGIGEKILAAAAAYCEAQLPSFLVEHHQVMRAYWGRTLIPAERIRLLPLVRALLDDIADLHVVYRPGDLPLDATRNSLSGKPAPRFRAAEAVLGRTPGGRALIDRLFAALDGSTALFMDPTGPLARFVRGSQGAGHKAANAYAREKGFADIYDVPKAVD